jgi:hypothetical protein
MMGGHVVSNETRRYDSSRFVYVHLLLMVLAAEALWQLC